jgi:hypothetical protein
MITTINAEHAEIAEKGISLRVLRSLREPLWQRRVFTCRGV